MQKRLLFLIFTVLFGACTSKPIVQGNSSAASQDIDECMDEGKANIGTGAGKAALKGGATGAAAGVVGGFVSGLFSGNATSGALQGGTVGLAAGATGGAIYGADGDSMFQNYVNECLQSRGHKVLGWR